MSASVEPIQRLTDLPDPQTRALVDMGVSMTVQSNMAHLRSIKETELKWLELLAVVSLASVGYLLSAAPRNPVFSWAMSGPVISYFLLAAWIQFVLANERLSYYGLLRSVVRGQNLLGLYEMRFLSPRLADSAFPKGMGPDPTTDGTQPFSSFLHRQLYTAVLLTAIVSAATFRVLDDAPWFWVLSLSVLALDVVWLVHLFRRDRSKLTQAWSSERRLAGADPAWFASSAVAEDAGGEAAHRRASAPGASASPAQDGFVAAPESGGPVVPREAVAELGEQLRRRGRRVVMTNGHFDLLHVGHVRCLEYARSLGDCLVVAINDDPGTRASKGEGRPIVPAADRAEMLAGLASVDYVTIFSDRTAEQVLRDLRPDVYVKGGDYADTPEGERLGAKPLPEARAVAEFGGKVAIFPLIPDRSTTDIETRILTARGKGAH